MKGGKTENVQNHTTHAKHDKMFLDSITLGQIWQEIIAPDLSYNFRCAWSLYITLRQIFSYPALLHNIIINNIKQVDPGVTHDLTFFEPWFKKYFKKLMCAANF